LNKINKNNYEITVSILKTKIILYFREKCMLNFAKENEWVSITHKMFYRLNSILLIC